MIRFQCPQCHSSLRVDLKYAGKRVRCPKPECDQPIKIPRPKTDKQLPVAKKQNKQASQPLTISRKRKVTQPSVATSKQRSINKNTKTHRIVAVIAGLFLLVAATKFLFPTTDNTGNHLMQSNVAFAAAPVAKPFEKDVQPFLKKYCYDCHGEDIQEGGVRLDQFKQTPNFLAEYKFWEKIHQQISVGSMPPQDSEVPDQTERNKVAHWLDQQINHFDCNAINNPGRVTIHRLNRVEYDNTIRDLLGVNLHLSANFPSDDVGYGFDNIGDVLSTSPLLMERYLDAAEKVSQAMGKVT